MCSLLHLVNPTKGHLQVAACEGEGSVHGEKARQRALGFKEGNRFAAQILIPGWKSLD